MPQYKAGDECLVVRDVTIDGKNAFYRGNYITIKEVKAHDDEATYVVHSDRLDKDIELVESDVALRPVPDSQKRGKNRKGIQDSPKYHSDKKRKPLPKDDSEKKRSLYGGLHRVLFLVGLACLILGFLFSTVYYQKEALVGGYLLGAAFLIAIADGFAYHEYRQYLPAMSQATKTLSIVVAAVCMSILLTLAGVAIYVHFNNNSKRNVYVGKATGLMDRQTRLMEEERKASIDFGEECQPIAALEDLASLQAGYAGLAEKYIPLFQRYSGELETIEKEFIALQPPKQYEQYHKCYINSCESLFKGMTSIIEGMQLLRYINENTFAQISSIEENTARYLKEAEELGNEARGAWPREAWPELGTSPEDR